MKAQEFEKKLSEVEYQLNLVRSRFSQRDREGVDRILKQTKNLLDELMKKSVEFYVTYRVVLYEFETENREALTALIRKELQLSIMEVKPFLDSRPSFMGTGLSKTQAADLVVKLTALKAKVSAEKE